MADRDSGGLRNLFRWMEPCLRWAGIIALVLACIRGVPLLPALLMGLLLLCAAWRLHKQVYGRGYRCAHALGAAGILLVSCLLSLVLLEAGARLAFGPPPTTRQHDATYFWKPRPGGQGVQYVRDEADEVHPVSVRFSSQGLRDRVFGPKAPGEFRVLLLGDSFTFGLAVEEEHAISRYLEREWAGRPDSAAITVINAGAPAYAPWRERMILRERGFPLNPDLVVLQLFPGNDFNDTLQKEGLLLRAYIWRNAAAVERARLHPSWPAFLERGLDAHSVFYRRLNALLGRGFLVFDAWNAVRFLPPEPKPYLPPPENRPPYLEPSLVHGYETLELARQMLRDDVAAIQRDCRERGIPLAGYAIPPADSAIDSLWQIHMEQAAAEYERGKGVRLCREIFEELGIPYIPVGEAMLAHPDARSLYYLYDGHCSEAGHAFIAGVLRAHLEQRNLVPGPADYPESPPASPPSNR